MTVPVNIAGIGTYGPRLVKKSADFDCAAAGVDPQWVSETGIQERRWASSEESIVDLAWHAGRRALEHADLSPKVIDGLFLVSSTLQPGLIVPSGAARLQTKLGIEKGSAFFLLETCCGALMAMDLAAASIRAGRATNVLVVAAETFSKTFNPTNPLTFKIGMSMGDGAAAVVLTGRSDWPDGQVATWLKSSGDFQSGLGMRPDCQEQDGEKRAGIFFGFGRVPPSSGGKPLPPDGAIKEIKRFTTSTVPAALEAARTQAGLGPDDIDFYLLHQPSREFLDGWKRAANIPPGKTLDTLQNLGNLSSVSVLTNLDMAYQQGRLLPGATVALAAVGEGGSWGAMIWKWRLTPDSRHRSLLAEPPVELRDRLINIERYSMIELWEKHILPGTKDRYRQEELFSDFVPSMAVFEGVPLEAAYEFLSRSENMSLWTMSMRNVRPFRGDIYLADETATPTGKVYIQTLADPAAKTIGWNCGHADPEDLWIRYRGMLVDALPTLGRKGTAFFWTNFVHERVKQDRMLAMGFKAMYAAHKIEIENLKMILEDRFAAKGG
ncbi:MAG: 3-oxoacyl-ACP synthase III family protein [Deltaproteobacteria bacterium]|nr:3-oxoacyl-ACP synthase III family protein [Deltaproteobacteria bacterium]